MKAKEKLAAAQAAPRAAVTIARNAGASGTAQGRQWAAELGLPFIERPRNMSLEQLLMEQGLEAVVVVTSAGPEIFSLETRFAYHPSMAVLRLQNLKRGQSDHLVAALDLQPGGRVFDGTLGLAADAALASYVVGEQGSVIGTEAAPLLAFAVRHGLAYYEAEDADLTAALRRIKAVGAKAEDYLAACKADSFDVCYFDPMFRYPVSGSKNMDALRPLSYEMPLSKKTIELALKVAPRVVIKERSEHILRQYGCTEFVGGKYSRVKYGIIRR